MIARTVRALLFEHATRTWPFLAAGLALGLLYVSPFPGQAGEFRQTEFELFCQTIALVIATLGLLYSAADGERLTCELTQRTLLLPVPTVVIVTTKFIFNTACIFLVSLSIHGVLRLVLDPPRDDWWAYPLLAVAIFVILQTLALAVGCLGDWSLGILAGALVATLGYLENHLADRSTAELVAATLGLFGLGLLASCVVVHLRRTGRWDPALLLPRHSRARAPRGDHPLPPFTSALEAQRWFESRRSRPMIFGIYGCIAATIGLAGIAPRATVQRFYEDYTLTDRLLWAAGNYGMTFPLTMLLTAVFAGAVVFVQNFRMQSGSMQAFLCLRPMSTANLAHARVAAAERLFAVLSGVTAVLSIAFFSCWLLIDKANPATGALENWGLPALYARIALGIIAVAVPAWIGYWTGNVLVGFLGYVIIGNLRAVSIELSSMEEFTLSITAAALASSLVYTLAVRRSVVSIPRVCATLAIAFAASFALPLLGAWPNFLSERPYTWDLEDLPFFAAFALIIAAPTATVPLALHWSRHR